MSKRLFLYVAIILAMVLTSCAAPAAPTAVPAAPKAAEPTKAPAAPEPTKAPAAPAAGTIKELKILWAQWDPADYLQQVGKMYEKETGIKVTIVQEPWGSFGDRFFAEMAAKGTAWDMVVGDSQWLGQGATQGHYLELTDFMKSNGIDKSVTKATLTYYGEYPANSVLAYPRAE